MKLTTPSQRRYRAGLLGFSLEELTVSMGLALGSITAIVGGYRVALYRVEWTTSSMAAQSLAVQRLEQVRTARWEPQAGVAIDEVQPANFPTSVGTLDVPVVGTNVAVASITTTIRTIVADPPLKWVQVDCVWSCGAHGPFTNTVTALRTPDL